MAEFDMTQYNMRKGLNFFEDEVDAAIKKEVRQLLNLYYINTDDPKDITKEERHTFTA